MTSSRLLVLTLSHARRRLHQAVARAPPSQPPPDYLHIYHDLMLEDPPQRHVDTPNSAVDCLLADYAKQGNTQDFESVVSRIAPLTEHQRDLHIKAHIVSALLPTHPSSSATTQHFPTNGLALLHQYEASGRFAPIKSYTRLISALFNVQTSPSSQASLGRAAAHAHAWDLFAHMRYVAHPVPDAHLYALMIRACGLSSRPEPERALDLWTEMHENGVKPTKGAYEAVIRVCGRSGPEWVAEGLRLAREMSDHYSISGSGRGLWCALLEGCKRAGDLRKARWILAEAVRGGSACSEDAMVDADLMTHVFHTYASYKVPFRRESTRLVHSSTESSEHAPANKNLTKETPPSTGPIKDDDITVEHTEGIPSFSRLPPQTSSEVIAEARTLFDKILLDKHLSMQGPPHSHQGGLLTGRFARVELTPMLVNAYLSVFYSHATIETSRDVFGSLFNRNHSSVVKVLRADEYTCINTLERCATVRVEERHVAARWAEDVWRRWEVIETSSLKSGRGNVGSFARLVERAHAAMRRVLVLSEDVDGALALLRTFVSRYPPNAALQPTKSRVSPDASSVMISAEPSSKSMAVQPFSKPHVLSTRTVLTNPVSVASSTARPLVRLTSVVTPKDDRVPPIVAFSDVELLHARLAEYGRAKDLGYIKWVCMAYSSALKKRRDAVLRAAPIRDEEVD